MRQNQGISQIEDRHQKTRKTPIQTSLLLFLPAGLWLAHAFTGCFQILPVAPSLGRPKSLTRTGEIRSQTGLQEIIITTKKFKRPKEQPTQTEVPVSRFGYNAPRALLSLSMSTPVSFPICPRQIQQHTRQYPVQTPILQKETIGERFLAVVAFGLLLWSSTVSLK